MSFSTEFLDEIRARVPLAGIVGRRVKLTRRGREHSGLCPFHNEKSPSFTLNEDKGFYHCFGCGAHGDVIGFVMRAENLAFPEAVERLAGEAGLEVPRASPEARAEAQRRATLLEVLEAATSWFEEQLRGAQGAEARAYLTGRGLRDESIAAFRLGFAPDRRGALRMALNARGIDDRHLVEAGLIKEPEAGGAPRDYFFNRVMFPITDRRGRVIAFGARALGDAAAKYLNSPDTPLFHKGRTLYNLSRARQAARDSGELIVVEGYMDVISLAKAGFPAAVAPLGTAVTGDQIAELWRLVEEPVLCLDGDSAGRRAGLRVAERALPLLKPGHSLRFAVLPKGEDPDSLVRGNGPEALRGVLRAARPLVDLAWAMEAGAGEAGAGRFETPERQAGLVRALDRRLRQIADPDVQKAYREALNQRFFDIYGYGAWGRPARTGPARPRIGLGKGRTGFGRASGGFQGRSQSQFQGRSQGRNQGRHQARPGTGGGHWYGPADPSAHQSPGLLARRQEQVLLAALVNHPELIVEYAEALAELTISAEPLERLFQAALDLGAREPDLDTDALKCHLTKQGFSAVLSDTLHPRVYVHGRFARPDGSPDDARAGVLHILEGCRRRRAETEAEQAGRSLAAALAAGAGDASAGESGAAEAGAASEVALAQLQTKRKQIEESNERWFELDRIDEAET